MLGVCMAVNAASADISCLVSYVTIYFQVNDQEMAPRCFILAKNTHENSSTDSLDKSWVLPGFLSSHSSLHPFALSWK